MSIEDELRRHPYHSLQHHALINLMYTSSVVMAEHSKELKRFGLSIQQYNILRILRGSHPKPCSVNYLKERMLDRMSNVSRLVEKLRQKGLVTRDACPSDRRAVEICITEQGIQLLNDMDPCEKVWVAQLLPLSDEEARTLTHLLNLTREANLINEKKADLAEKLMPTSLQKT